MITINNTIYSSLFKNLLQSYINIHLNNKVWRSGYLILYKQSGYYIELTLKDKEKNIERFELPIPFDVLKNNDTFILSYKLSSLAQNDSTLYNLLQKLDTSRSKFYDTNLMIEVIQP